MRYDDGLPDIVVPHRVEKRVHAFAFDPGRADRVAAHAERVRCGLRAHYLRVKCVERPDLGELNVNEMAEALGLQSSRIGDAARGGNRLAGLAFARAGREWKRKVQPAWRAVVCETNGRRFDNARDAANWAGLKSRSSIQLAIGIGGTAGGHRWRYAGTQAGRRRARVRRALPVLCVETGTVYPSLRAAALAMGKQHNTGIHNAITHGHAGYGLHWKYVEKTQEAA